MKKGGNPTETVGNALEAECYSEASSAAFISLFLISITSLYIERETGIEPATSRVENHSPSHRNGCFARHGFNAVAETTQFSDHFSGTALCL